MLEEPVKIEYQEDKDKEKKRKKEKKKGYKNLLIIIGIIIAFFLGSFVGPSIDHFQNIFRHDYRTDSTVSGLQFSDVDEKYFPKTIKTEDYGGILTTFVPLHLDKFHAGETIEGKIFMGNITKGDLEVKLESVGPVKVLFDESKVGEKVIIPSGKQTYIPIVLQSPSKKVKEYEPTILNLSFINKENVKVQVPINVEAPRIIPPLKPDSDSFMAQFQYLYALFVFYTYDYLPFLLLIVGLIIIGSIVYVKKKKRGKENDEKTYKQMEQSA